jgi:hypothetical protein
MFCLQCGATLPDGAHFCSQCGTAVGATAELEQSASTSEPRHDNHKPALIVKPRMVGWVVLARYIPLQINLTVMGAVIFGLLAVGYHIWAGTLVHPIRPFLFFGAFFFLLVPLLIYIAYRKTINAVRYEFYRDRLEYYDGFWTIQHKVLYYKHITEITLRRNMIQRLYGIGTIHFAVPSIGPKYAGLFLSDIQHPAILYEQIEQLVRSY